MRNIFDRKWFIGTVAAWILILILDELTFSVWKSMNPGTMYSGLLVKHPIQNWEGPGNGVPNGTA